MALKEIAGLDRADAVGRAGVDEVAGGELDQAGEEADGLGDVPDEIGEIALLLDRAVDLELDQALCRMADAGSRHDRRAGRRAVEALAHVPGLAGGPAGVLQVAPSHAEAGAVAIDHA